MRLRFLDRSEELQRLERAFLHREATLVVLYGRRRCGKSRLLREALSGRTHAYYVSDDREAALQRRSLAAEMARLVPGFGDAEYPEWDALLSRWWRDAPAGAVLALDEFPSLVAVSPELPSIIQRHLEPGSSPPRHIVLCGSSQRMMQGLILDASAPLYGRAREILPVKALRVGWLPTALRISDACKAIEAYSVWGGVPRYWELALDCRDTATAIRTLVLDPMGVLYREPVRLLLDDMREITQAASILSLIGQGCCRMSETAGRLGKPATSLVRPMQRLVELGLVTREVPFGVSERNSKKSFYRISDPFLRFWFRYVEPNRSRLEAGQIPAVEGAVRITFSEHVGSVWEDLARESVPHIDIGGIAWKPARRWWGAGLDRRPLEIDIVAESDDGKAILIGEAVWAAHARPHEIVQRLKLAAERFPLAERRKVVLAAWLRQGRTADPSIVMVNPAKVMRALR